MPMLKFKSSGSGSQGEMVENNTEYFYFFLVSSQFMAWSLLAGLLLPDDNKYVGLSFSGFAMILIYLYIEVRIHDGKSFKYIELVSIEKSAFEELETQGLMMKDQHLSQQQECHEIRENDDVEPQSISEKNMVNNRHKEWKRLYTVFTKRCHSCLKFGSEDSEPSIPFQTEDIIKKYEEFKSLTSLEEKTKMMSDTGLRADIEYYNYSRYKAYMKGMLGLKINHYREELSAAIESILREMKSLLIKNSDSDRFKKYGQKLSTRKFLNMPEEGMDDFAEAYREYKEMKIKRDAILQEKRLEEERRKKERLKTDRKKYLKEDEERKWYENKLRQIKKFPLHKQDEELKRIDEELDKRMKLIQVSEDYIMEDFNISDEGMDEDFLKRGRELYSKLLDNGDHKIFVDNTFHGPKAIYGKGFDKKEHNGK
jgi:hypothetical protein